MKYKKKQEEIEAIQYNGPEQIAEIAKLLESSVRGGSLVLTPGDRVLRERGALEIVSSDGTHTRVNEGDYVVLRRVGAWLTVWTKKDFEERYIKANSISVAPTPTPCECHKCCCGCCCHCKCWHHYYWGDWWSYSTPYVNNYPYTWTFTSNNTSSAVSNIWNAPVT